jgi:hypothetical protein
MKLEFKLLGGAGLALLVVACFVAFGNREATGPHDADGSSSDAETFRVRPPDLKRQPANKVSGIPEQERTTTRQPVDEASTVAEPPAGSGSLSSEDDMAPRTPEESASKRVNNEFWRTGATQDGFHHRPRNGKLVIDQSDLDEEFHIPIEDVKQAFGFDAWFKPRDGLIPGFKFDVAEHPELTGFSIHSDESRACYSGDVTLHGVERRIQLRRSGDESAWIAIDVVVALSVDTAQEKMVPVLRQTQMASLRTVPPRINQLALGDVSSYQSTHDHVVKYVCFTRHNVYFSMEGQMHGGNPIRDVDFVAFAQKLDAVIQAISPVSMEELEALRPRVTRFELERDTLHGPKPETRRCAVYWDVDAPRGGKLTVFADGPDNLQYDDRANPSVIRGSTEGKHTARLIVIDEWLLFDWQDAPVEVR